MTADARDIMAFEWTFDDRHLVFVQDRDGDENAHLFTVHADTGTITDLTPFDGVRPGSSASPDRFPARCWSG